VQNRDIGIWSAGCSTGEEPYTIAMIIDEFFADDKKWWDTRILATDISGKVLEKAGLGIYSSESLSYVPVRWRNKYFRKHGENTYIIDDRIKKEIIFRKFNLMEDIYPLRRKFHVIFCRNVMIYFDKITKDRLVEKFYNFTEPGGYLFIGHSESLNRNESGYKYIMPAVYRKE
jgi:chemotaxis protein methyltransferase CheR